MSFAEYDKVNKNIDGMQFELKLLNTSEAFISGQELLKLTLPSLGAFADGVTTPEDPFNENTTFTAIAFHLTKQLGDVNTLHIIKQMLAGATVDGQPINFETFFRGRLGLLVKVVEFAVKENYGSLFTDTGLRELLTGFMKGLATQTSEQPKSVE